MKSFVSLVAVGVLTSLLSMSGTAHAEKTNYEFSKKAVEFIQDEKSLMKESINPQKLNQLEADMKSLSSSVRMGINNTINATDDPLFESEPNDDFNIADLLPYDRLMAGQLLPIYDLDFFKITVPAEGILLVAGMTNNPNAIELYFEAFEEDFEDNGFLEYLGTEYEDGVEVQVYQVHKAGTYFAATFDLDNEYGYDDNGVDDLYGIMTSFLEDVTEPSMPNVNEITENTTNVTGTADIGSTITVQAGLTVLGKGITRNDGKFTVSIPKQQVGTIVTVTATDDSGNISVANEIEVQEGKVVNRIFGIDRIQTAIAISKNGWETALSVILAQGNNFPDALAASPLAYQLDAPILLTKQNSLSAETIEELIRLKTENVIIVGGEGAVSKTIEATLVARGINVERVAGVDRFDTAAKIALRMGGNPDKANVTDGSNFPDALAISSYAAQNGYPILLTRKDRLPTKTNEVLKSIPNTIVMGGNLAVSSTVFNQLNNPIRISGNNRYETAVAVIETFNLPTDKVYVATGDAFADALTGSALAARNNSHLILVRQNTIPVPTAQLIAKYNIRNFTLLGGEVAISNNLIQ